METTDFWADWPTRVLWVAGFEPVLYPVIRALKPKWGKSPSPQWVLRLGYDETKEEELQRAKEAKKKMALAKQSQEKAPRVRIHIRRLIQCHDATTPQRQDATTPRRHALLLLATSACPQKCRRLCSASRLLPCGRCVTCM